jgi:hypothetical protein
MSAKPKPERGPASKPLTLYPLKFEEIVRDVLTIKPPPKAPKAKRKGRSKAP